MRDVDIQLISSIKHININGVHAAIRRGADVNVVPNDIDLNDNQGFFNGSPIVLAMNCCFYEAAKVLVNNGADVNPIDNWTPLSLAVDHDDLHMAEFFLDNGAKIDAAGLINLGHSPLSVACGTKSVAMVELLLKNNADINSLDDNGETPLMHAVQVIRHEQDKLSVIKTLLEHGADITLKNKWGNTVIDIARNAFDNKIVALIENYQDRVRLAGLINQEAHDQPIEWAL